MSKGPEARMSVPEEAGWWDWCAVGAGRAKVDERGEVARAKPHMPCECWR